MATTVTATCGGDRGERARGAGASATASASERLSSMVQIGSDGAVAAAGVETRGELRACRRTSVSEARWSRW